MADVPPRARRRIDADRVVWLTTITDRDIPAPNPVWYVPDGDAIVVFTAPTSHKVRNLEQRPQVALHFNTDPAGSDVVVITGQVEITHGEAPSRFPGYLAKYGPELSERLGWTVEELDRGFSTQLRIMPTRVRLFP